MSETRIDLEGGKYTVIHNDDGVGLHALRHGSPWRSLLGDGLVLAMAQEIETLRAARVDLLVLADAVLAWEVRDSSFQLSPEVEPQFDALINLARSLKQ